MCLAALTSYSHHLDVDDLSQDDQEMIRGFAMRHQLKLTNIQYMRIPNYIVTVTVDIARQRGAQGQEGEGRARIRR